MRRPARMILNLDDACALAFALTVKSENPHSTIELVTMAPRSVIPHMHDLLRMDVDIGTLITDSVFAGSDTFVTSEILSRYIASCSYDCIVTGSRSLDGDTAQVPAQIAEALGLEQISGIVSVDRTRFSLDRAVVDVEDETTVTTYELPLPAVLGMTRASGYELPYLSYQDMERDVSDKLVIVTNEELAFSGEEVGLAGSLTRVVRTYEQQYRHRGGTVVSVDDEGVECVFLFLKEGEYL